MVSKRVLGTSAVLIAGVVAAPANAGGPARDLTCDAGSYTKTASRASLTAALGAANLKDVGARDVFGDGKVHMRTIVYPGRADREIEILWADDALGAKGGPTAMTISGACWRGPFGVHAGSTLAEVEAANGGLFEMTGFAEDEFSGVVYGGRGGAIGKALRGRVLSMVFTPSNTPGGTATQPATMPSYDPGIRAAKPVVSSIGLSFWERR